jgi:hypothetical protein
MASGGYLIVVGSVARRVGASEQSSSRQRCRHPCDRRKKGSCTEVGHDIRAASPYGPSMQDLLHPDIATHLAESTSVIKNWIAIRGPGFAESLKIVKRRAIQNVRSIRSYFASGGGNP